MPPINPSLEQWMLQQRNRGVNTGLGVRGGWGDGMRNDRGMMGAPMSGDQYALLLNGQNANQTRQLRTQADLQRAQEESQFLDSINPMDLGGIYNAPEDPRQAQLQAILNRDYLAREAGSRRSMAGILSNQEIDRKMAPHRLNVAQFRDAQAQDRILNALRQESFAAGREDEMTQRKFNEKKFEDDTLYRQAQLQRQDRDFDYKGQVTDRRADQQDFRNMVVMERELARQAAADGRNAFNAAVEMGQRGIPTQDVERAFPELSDAQRSILRGYDQRAAEQGKFAESIAAGFTRDMQAVPTYDTEMEMPSKWNPFNWVGSPVGMAANAGRMTPTITKTDRPPEQIQRDRDEILKRIEKNPKYRDMLMYDPETNTVSPSPQYARRSSAGAGVEVIPVPENLRARYQNGQTYNKGAFRYENGQLIRLR